MSPSQWEFGRWAEYKLAPALSSSSSLSKHHLNYKYSQNLSYSTVAGKAGWFYFLSGKKVQYLGMMTWKNLTVDGGRVGLGGNGF